jgi:hypothetical protein
VRELSASDVSQGRIRKRLIPIWLTDDELPAIGSRDFVANPPTLPGAPPPQGTKLLDMHSGAAVGTIAASAPGESLVGGGEPSPCPA